MFQHCAQCTKDHWSSLSLPCSHLPCAFVLQDVRSLIQRFDRDGDGQLSMREFFAFLKKEVPELDKGDALHVLEDVVVQVSCSFDAARDRDNEERHLSPMDGDMAMGQLERPCRLWLQLAPRKDSTSLPSLAISSLVVVPPSATP